MKIVHAADLHLDSPLRGLTAYEGAPIEDVRSATRRALGALIDLCVQEEARLLLIAGDLYDGDFRDYSTALFFIEQVARLREVGTKVVWIRGNHDAANRITKHLRTAEHVTELSHDTPETVVLEELGVAIHGQGYKSRDVVDNIARLYPQRYSDLLNIGLLHTALDGREGHAPYAPCTLSDLTSKGYDYWALGHVHKREVLSQDPWVVFPGNLQGRHIRETGPKGATLIRVEAGGIQEVEARALDCVRWELVEVNLSQARTLSDVLDLATAELTKKRASAHDRVLATRVRLVGATEAHGILSQERARVENELRAFAVDEGDIYLERVQRATVGSLAASALTERTDALGDLFRAMQELCGDPEAKQLFWEELLRPLSGVSVDLLRDDALRPDEILTEARALLEGRLLSSEDDG